MSGARQSLGLVAVATNFCIVAPSICVCSVWTLLNISFQSPRILRGLLFFFFLKNFKLLFKII